MKKTIMVELALDDKEDQLFIDWLVKNHIKHNIYTFEIGNIKHNYCETCGCKMGTKRCDRCGEPSKESLCKACKLAEEKLMEEKPGVILNEGEFGFKKVK